jgi:formylglycine-generating enzyme required for sulfatase activity
MSRPAIIIVAVVLLAVGGVVALRKLKPASGSGARKHEVLNPKSGGDLALLPGGEFTMGQKGGRPDETPHKVSIAPLYMDRHAVTVELYEQVMGACPSKLKDKKAPFERAQWIDAALFCNKASALDGLKPCYNTQTWECDFSADGYRLPTEAEWEYACRAGSATAYSFGDSEAALSQHAWFKNNSGGQPHPVGQKSANAFGLYDMHGNVSQWCNDVYDENYYQASPADNPRGPVAGPDGKQRRVLRGGSCYSPAEKCASSFRAKEFQTFPDACFGNDAYGFRRVRSVKASPAVAANPAPAPAPAPDSKNPVVEKPPAPPADKPADAVAGPGGTKDPAPPKPAGKLEAGQLKGTIVFVSDRSGTLNIWAMQASGKNQRALTTGANPAADPRFSPDGKTILYTLLKNGIPEVWRMNFDGSKPQSITQGSQGNWSPDGKSIVFIRDNQTFVRELEGGKEWRVTPDNWERCGVPAWSPDGKRIALASRHTGNIGVFVVSVDGKETAQIPTKEDSCTPFWSADGKRLLCQTVKGHVHQVDADGKNWEQITFGADMQHHARYSPDGSLILFCRAPNADGPWQVCVMRPDADDFVKLTSEGSNSLPDWTAAE